MTKLVPAPPEVRQRRLERHQSKMITKTVEVYRLWKNDKWDKVPITIEIPEGLEESEEFIESKAVQQAWLNIAMISIGAKPFQIGLYMQSLYGVEK